MTAIAQPCRVFGFLGAGKTRLCRELESHSGLTPVEMNGLCAPFASPGAGPAITVVDCANIAHQLKDPLIGPLVTRQIATADQIVLSRTDLADREACHALVAPLSAAPVHAAAHDTLDVQALLAVPTPLGGPADAADDLRDAFTEWSYGAALRFDHARAEKLAEERPKGTLRLSAQLRTRTGGLEIEIAGRVRQTQPIKDPGESRVRAMGPKGIFDPRALEMWFAEAAMDSAHMSGVFGYR